ncbi:unnamed protein product [Prorocentrum cordatum]|uniref:Uncharacterized protein n=1 Tax=Prorocentrum cordatum TaxID=2364126 RepID=A0ABN9PTU7_9DINO|nr:unnamed protein product [Polarella glacialis]
MLELLGIQAASSRGPDELGGARWDRLLHRGRPGCGRAVRATAAPAARRGRGPGGGAAAGARGGARAPGCARAATADDDAAAGAGAAGRDLAAAAAAGGPRRSGGPAEVRGAQAAQRRARVRWRGAHRARAGAGPLARRRLPARGRARGRPRHWLDRGRRARAGDRHRTFPHEGPRAHAEVGGRTPRRLPLSVLRPPRASVRELVPGAGPARRSGSASSRGASAHGRAGACLSSGRRRRARAPWGHQDMRRCRRPRLRDQAGAADRTAGGSGSGLTRSPRRTPWRHRLRRRAARKRRRPSSPWRRRGRWQRQAWSMWPTWAADARARRTAHSARRAALESFGSDVGNIGGSVSLRSAGESPRRSHRLFQTRSAHMRPVGVLFYPVRP